MSSLVKHGVALGLLAVFLFTLNLLAFTEPTSSPPSSNVPAPLNVGFSGQSKSGGLILNTGGAAIGLIVDKGQVCIGTDCRSAWPGEAPSGALLHFNRSSCPSGWSAFTPALGRYLVAGGALGTTVGTALGDGENRPVGQHNHALSDPGHIHSLPVLDNIDNGGYGNLSRTWPTRVDNYYNTNSSQTNITIAPSGSTPGTNAPYIQVLLCQKN